MLKNDRLDEIRSLFHQVPAGPWEWFGNLKTFQIYLATVGRGRQFVMTFERWGMREAQPAFRNEHDTMVKAERWARSISDHNKAFYGIPNPCAAFLARSWQMVADLIRMVDERDSEIERLRSAFFESRTYEDGTVGRDLCRGCTTRRDGRRPWPDGAHWKGCWVGEVLA